ncbi:MAG: copper-binding protein [Nevskiaceae bacterium]|nr:MAG: copper-binding protein [Nevskiaceae bacterium]TBR72085.1 MAG: copper-binding protein [Nevskiaceae bacterium]
MHDTTQGAQVNATGTGVVEAVDQAQGAVTIKHQAIAALDWPAMTMAFKAANAELLKEVKVGEKIGFGLHAQGMNGTLIWIKSAQP